MQSRTDLPQDLAVVVFPDLEHNEWWHYGVLDRLEPGMELRADLWQGDFRLWFGPIRVPSRWRDDHAIHLVFSRNLPPKPMRHVRLKRH